MQIKLFGNYRYQLIEEEFNIWAEQVRPFVIKSILTTAAVPKPEGGNSLYFALAVFYNLDHSVEPRCPEEFPRPKIGKVGGVSSG